MKDKTNIETGLSEEKLLKELDKGIDDMENGRLHNLDEALQIVRQRLREYVQTHPKEARTEIKEEIFHNWDDFVVYGKAIYDVYEDKEEWIDHLMVVTMGSYLGGELCVGTPGVFCVYHDDESMTCDRCLKKHLGTVKHWFDIED